MHTNCTPVAFPLALSFALRLYAIRFLIISIHRYYSSLEHNDADLHYVVLTIFLISIQPSVRPQEQLDRSRRMQHESHTAQSNGPLSSSYTANAQTLRPLARSVTLVLVVPVVGRWCLYTGEEVSPDLSRQVSRTPIADSGLSYL